MGRAQGGTQTVIQVKRASLTERQKKILEVLHEEGMGPVTYLKSTGLTPAIIRKELQKLEEMGKITKVYNPDGPQTPWWYQKARKEPENYEIPELTKGQIWDWGEPSERLWVEVLDGTNEYGMVKVGIRAGEHNTERTVLPRYYFARILYPRRQSEITDYSSQFSCPCHGTCNDAMIRTDKRCALCMTLLIRH
jgi:hypothetical protein